MANTVTFSNLYLVSQGPGANQYTIEGGDVATSVIVGDENDGDLSDEDTTGDGVEAPGEAVAYSVNGNPIGSATYTGDMIGSGIVIQNTTTSQYFLATNDSYGVSDVADSTSGNYEYPVCFLPGTLITTPQGERPIESLAIGDEITLGNGQAKPIKWVGRLTTKLHRFNRNSATPVLIRAGALGGGLPKRDLYTTYDHGFALDGVLAIAGVLVNGTSIVQCSDWAEDELTYFQLEVEGHELMVVEGVGAETFVDNGTNRSKFDNAEEFHALHPEAVPAEPMALGRVSVRRQLPRAVAQRIARAAAQLAKKTRVA